MRLPVKLCSWILTGSTGYGGRLSQIESIRFSGIIAIVIPYTPNNK